MEQLTLADLLENEEHTARRGEWQKRMIALGNARRLAIGPFMSGAFENRETVKWQVQEMCRIEKIVDDKGRSHELETYNPLIPAAGELSMTLMIEIDDKERRAEFLPGVVGIEHHVFVSVGDERVKAESEIHEDDAPKAPAVHFLKFPLSPGQVEFFRGGVPAAIVIDHPLYRFDAPIRGALREALAAEIVT